MKRIQCAGAQPGTEDETTALTDRARRPGLGIPVLAAVLTLGVLGARADERLAGIACRSVHLQYAAPSASWFINEVSVEQCASGTFFMVCGFDKGYCGLQELADGRRLVIFSVWDDARGDDPRAVAEERRVRVLDQGQGVRVGRFGGEGTGAQTFYDVAWKTGVVCAAAIHARTDAGRTAFTAWFRGDEKGDWKKLATLETPAARDRLRGMHSFVEDFRRNRVSLQHARRAAFGPGWTSEDGTTWREITKATFTADGNPARNIEAGVKDGRFFLSTGGNTPDGAGRLGSAFERPASGGKPCVPACGAGPQAPENRRDASGR